MLLISKGSFLRCQSTCWLRWVVLVTAIVPPVISRAVQPSEQLLPATTKFSIQIPDLGELRSNFDRTDLGHLMNDPLMQPFVDDLERQLRERLNESERRLGLTWEDLDMIDGGEICMAQIQPNEDKTQQATVVIVDTTGHEQEANAILKKIRRNRKKQKAKEKIETVPGTRIKMRVYTLPKKEGQEKPEETVVFVHDDQLVGTDHKEIARAICRRFDGVHNDHLASVVAYRESMKRLDEEYAKQGDDPPHIRWFMEPFGYLEVRSLIDDRQLSGIDIIQVLRDTGFREAIQGVGGFVSFAHHGREVLHRSFVYAPPAVRKVGDSATTKYNSAARLLEFPHTSDLEPEDWIPHELASFTTLNWKIKDASIYVEPLVDRILGGEEGEGTYSDIKESLRDDEEGPQIDIDKEFFRYLDDRLIWITDYEVPTSTTSERVMLAVRTNNPKKLAATIRKTMKSDQNATEHNIDGHVVWEVIETENEVVEPPEIDGLPAFFGEDEDETEEEDPLQPLFPYKVSTIHHGYMIIATHMDLLKSLLNVHPSEQRLNESAEYRRVMQDLEQLGARNDSLKLFARVDEQCRVTYELVKQGIHPESKTLFGNFVNWFYAPEENDKLRKQRIDGTKMPDFQMVRRYLGTTGLYVQTENNGWFVAGSLLPKDAGPAAAQVVGGSTKAR